MDDKMNLIEKLTSMRAELQAFNLKKSGNNNGRKYFELADFLPHINDLCKKYRVGCVVSFTEEEATLTMIDGENIEHKLSFTSPFGSATLKGCHEVQNIGAVETYQRRYLYMTAFEIVEYEMLDSSDYYREPELSLADILSDALRDGIITKEKMEETIAVANQKKPSEIAAFTQVVLNKLNGLRQVR